MSKNIRPECKRSELAHRVSILQEAQYIASAKNACNIRSKYTVARNEPEKRENSQSDFEDRAHHISTPSIQSRYNLSLYMLHCMHLTPHLILNMI